MKIPKQVRNCIDHKQGCDCREWRYGQLESALKVIHTWAATAEKMGVQNISSITPRHDILVLSEELRYIKEKSYEALHCLDFNEPEKDNEDEFNT